MKIVYLYIIDILFLQLRRALLDNKDEDMTLEQLKQSYIKNSQQEIPKDMNLIGIV